MRYVDFRERMRAFDAVLQRRGFERVDQARPDHETDAPEVGYCLDLAHYARDYPRLAEGDLQIDTADIVVKLRGNQLRVLIEGDELSDLAERFDVVVPGGGSDLEEQVRVAAHQLDELLTAVGHSPLRWSRVRVRGWGPPFVRVSRNRWRSRAR